MSRRWLAVATVASLLLVAACNGAGAEDQPATTPRETEQGIVTLRAAPNGDSTELKLLVTANGCSGGTIPAGIHSVRVEQSADQVVIDVRVEVPEGTRPTTCPPNPILPAVAQLDAPLGDRSIKAIADRGQDHLWPVADRGFDDLLSATTVEGQERVGNSPDNPAPIGTVVSVGGWNIAVTGLVAPADVGVPALVGVAIAYVRESGTGNLFDDIAVTAVDSGEEYELAQDGCPLALEQLEPGVPGVNLEGNLCFRVSGGIAGLQLVLVARDDPSADAVYLATG
jgi:hypothetical protein